MTATDTAKGIHIEFNANQLKLIAILAMVVDHTAIVLCRIRFRRCSCYG